MLAGTKTSGHANIGKARHHCAGKLTHSVRGGRSGVGACMATFFRKHPPLCMPKAKECSTRHSTAKHKRR